MNTSVVCVHGSEEYGDGECWAVFVLRLLLAHLAILNKDVWYES